MTAGTGIALIHGLWMTALSWEHWVGHYNAKGYHVVARGWPGMEDIAQFRRDPSAVSNFTLAQIIEHYERIICGAGRAADDYGSRLRQSRRPASPPPRLDVSRLAIAGARVKGVYRLPVSRARISLAFLASLYPGRQSYNLGMDSVESSPGRHRVAPPCWAAFEESFKVF